MTRTLSSFCAARIDPVADTQALIARSRTDMMPLPIVLDADVLHRNVD